MTLKQKIDILILQMIDHVPVRAVHPSFVELVSNDPKYKDHPKVKQFQQRVDLRKKLKDNKTTISPRF